MGPDASEGPFILHRLSTDTEWLARHFLLNRVHFLRWVFEEHSRSARLR